MKNAPYKEVVTPVTAYKVGAFDEYISFCASGGLVTTDDGKISKMTALQFCQQWNIDRKTTYRWRRSPNFDRRVRQRREELFPLARETACWNRLYIIGMTGTGQPAVDAIKTILGHFGGLELPIKREHGSATTSLAELLYLANQEFKG